MKQIASPGLMHETGHSGLVHWDDPEGWAGGGVRMGNTCTPMADSRQCMAKPLQYCKVVSLQLKEILKIQKTKQTKTSMGQRNEDLGETEIEEIVSERCAQSLCCVRIFEIP